MQPVLSRTVSSYCIADRLEGVRGGRGAFRPPWSEAVGARPVGAEREPTRLAEAHLEESCRLGLRGLRARGKSEVTPDATAERGTLADRTGGPAPSAWRAHGLMCPGPSAALRGPVLRPALGRSLDSHVSNPG